MSRTLAFIGAAVVTSLAVFAGACWLRVANAASPHAALVHEQHAHAASGIAGGHAHTSAGDTGHVDLTVLPEAPRAGEPALLTFILTDSSGQPIENLMTHHGRKFHVLIVSEDMQVFGHIHPSDFDRTIEHGVAEVSFPFPQPGRYVVAGDFMTDHGSHTAQFIVEVAGPEPAAAAAAAAASPGVRVVEIGAGDRYTQPIFLRGTQDTDGYTVSLQVPDQVRAGVPLPLVYRFSKDRTPVTDLRPYLAAPLHLAVVNDDLSHFLHEHGTAAMPGHSGHFGHGGHQSQVPAAFGPEVTATVTFPEPGTYYLFGQATHGGKLLNTRFSIEVN